MSSFSVIQEGPVNALALNKDNSQVAIGGRNVFKVYAIEEDRFKEIYNLRSSKHLNLSFSCNDISWSLTDDHYLATAATNGHVCVWNLTKMGKAMQEQDYQEHKRTVNKVNFHNSEANRLISGSQDGTMKYFDIRTKMSVSTFMSNTESVRDVQFNPHINHVFAAVSENGSVQLWDIRRTDKYIQQFTAHSGPVFACDWHPEFPWLATASRDKTIKVWDLTSKPTLEHTIHTIASIGHVKWRPQRKYHIASCALVVDCSINIWDVRRPYIPFAAFNEHKDVATGVAFRSDPHIFLSSSRDCHLFQHDFKDAQRPANKANPQGISLNNTGEVLHASRIPVNLSLYSKMAGLVRKTSNHSPNQNENFHLASSILHHFHTLTEEPKGFYSLATKYILSGRSLSEMCDHNSKVAEENGREYISTVWQIVKTMYGEEYLKITTNKNNEDALSHSNVPLNSLQVTSGDQSTDDHQSKGGDTPAAQYSGGDDETETDDQVDHVGFPGFTSYSNFRLGLPRGDFFFGDNELDIELDGLTTISDFRNSFRNVQQVPEPQDWTLPNEAFNVRHEIQNHSPPSEHFPNHNSPDINDDGIIEDGGFGFLTVSNMPTIPMWDPSSVVISALKHHAALGDVQTAACILIVLGDQRRLLADLDEATQEHWLLGYIELLSRYRLWNVAAQVIKLSWIPNVNQLNQQSTRINTNCGKCSKPLQRAGWLCDRCHSSESALCSVCHQVVKGLYSWCQGCSHGGHLAHMQQWLSDHKVCPTGCGHSCEYS